MTTVRNLEADLAALGRDVQQTNAQLANLAVQVASLAVAWNGRLTRLEERANQHQETT